MVGAGSGENRSEYAHAVRVQRSCAGTEADGLVGPVVERGDADDQVGGAGLDRQGLGRTVPDLDPRLGARAGARDLDHAGRGVDADEGPRLRQALGQQEQRGAGATADVEDPARRGAGTLVSAWATVRAVISRCMRPRQPSSYVRARRSKSATSRSRAMGEAWQVGDHRARAWGDLGEAGVTDQRAVA